MPRPKKGQEAPAVERMGDAFWALLAEKPYAYLTVADVLRATGLNKNAFYYHYANLDALAKDAVERALPVELLMAMLRGFMGVDDRLDALVRDPKYQVHLDRLGLVAGRHGSLQLQETLKQAMRGAWFHALGIDGDSLGLNSSLAIEFALGGILSLLAYRAEHLPALTPRELFGSDFAQRMRKVLPGLLLETFLEEGTLGSSPLLMARLAAAAGAPKTAGRPKTDG